MTTLTFPSQAPGPSADRALVGKATSPSAPSPRSNQAPHPTDKMADQQFMTLGTHCSEKYCNQLDCE